MQGESLQNLNSSFGKTLGPAPYPHRPPALPSSWVQDHVAKVFLTAFLVLGVATQLVLADGM